MVSILGHSLGCFYGHFTKDVALLDISLPDIPTEIGGCFLTFLHYCCGLNNTVFDKFLISFETLVAALQTRVYQLHQCLSL